MPMVNDVRLRRAGPIDPDNDYPLWFEDGGAAGAPPVRLELVLDADPLAPVVGELPQPGSPVVFPRSAPGSPPGNFPDESFYYAAEAQLPVGGAGVTGRARVLMHLEAAFGGAGEPQEGMNVVFARLRVRMDDLVPGALYTVTHPYGQTAALEADDRGRVFHTEDLGIVEGDPTAVVRTGQVAPFLRGTTAVPAGYIADGNAEQRVTGSPLVDTLGQPINYVLIEGPGIRAAGGTPDPNDPANPDKVWTDLFTLQGRVAKRLGAWVDRSTYDTSGATPRLTVAARSVPQLPGTPNDLRVIGPGVNLKLEAQGEDQIAVFEVPAVPADDSLVLVNVSDSPPTRYPLSFTPHLVVTQAEHHLGADTLTVGWTCSDPTLAVTLASTGQVLTASPQVIPDVAAVPAVVELRVTTAAGQVVTARRSVDVQGLTSTAPPPTLAVASFRPKPVVTDVEVTLDGSQSPAATAHAWTQTAGPAVTLTDPATATARFTPTVPADYTFDLTVQGPGGPSTAQLAFEVTVAPTENLTITRVQYRTSQRRFLVEGSVGDPPNLATIEVNGTALGTASTDADGAWRLRQVLTAAQAALVPSLGSRVRVTARAGVPVEADVLIRN